MARSYLLFDDNKYKCNIIYKGVVVQAFVKSKAAAPFNWK